MKQLPLEFQERMKKLLGDEYEDFIKSYDEKPQRAFRVNTDKISLEEFEIMFGRTMEECYGDNVSHMIEENLLKLENGFLMLTKKGIDVSNYVFATFLD